MPENPRVPQNDEIFLVAVAARRRGLGSTEIAQDFSQHFRQAYRPVKMSLADTFRPSPLRSFFFLTESSIFAKI